LSGLVRVLGQQVAGVSAILRYQAETRAQRAVVILGGGVLVLALA